MPTVFNISGDKGIELHLSGYYQPAPDDDDSDSEGDSNESEDESSDDEGTDAADTTAVKVGDILSLAMNYDSDEVTFLHAASDCRA